MVRYFYACDVGLSQSGFSIMNLLFLGLFVALDEGVG